LTASGSGGTGNISYHWTTGETTQSIIVTPNTSETYYLTIFDANNCAFTSFVSQYVETCVGLNEKNQDLSLISIYPNPSTGKFLINIKGNYENSNIEIYNSLGMLISRKKTINDHESIDLTEQSDGIYFLKVIDQESTSTYRIIKN
jgi:hypothetical protein